MGIGSIPDDWRSAVGSAASPTALAAIAAFVTEERRNGCVLPAPGRVFAALEATPFASVRAVILGQDPYPDARYAEGLAFSVPADARPLPGSLLNILKERQADLGLELPSNGSLAAWAHHGVLLLNTVLTVREREAGSHRRAGWQALTDAIITAVAARPDPIAFLLWGKQAQMKVRLIDGQRHAVVFAAHPSPRSAHRGFSGTCPFSRANEELDRRGAGSLDWSLGEDG